MSEPNETQSSTQTHAESENARRVPTPAARKDPRLAVQAEKLRIASLTQAIRFGEQASGVTPRRVGILIGSAAIGAMLLGGTIGLSALLQWLERR